MTIQYDSPKITEMVEDLNKYGSTMRSQIDELEGAAKEFHANLTGDSAPRQFQIAKDDLLRELDDTLVKLDNLGKKVENALGRAIEADGKVGDGFADF